MWPQPKLFSMASWGLCMTATCFTSRVSLQNILAAWHISTAWLEWSKKTVAARHPSVASQHSPTRKADDWGLTMRTGLMQFAKDSFYMALRERLASLNPQRTVTLNGATRPAVIVAENELVIPVEPLPDAFYIEWAAARAVDNHSGSRALMSVDCVISHHTVGTVESGVDRGRTLAALDMELTGICQPARTSKRDFTRTPSL